MSGLYEYIKMAIQNIRANKGRSFLTMLGIIIGIASVIAIVSIGEGTKNQMNSEIDGIAGGRMGELDGNGSFRTYLLDALYNMTGEKLAAGALVQKVA